MCHTAAGTTLTHVAMEPPVPQASQSNSSDYYEDEDPQFLEALATAVLSGDLPSDIKEVEHDPEKELEPPPPSQPSVKRQYSQISSDEKKNGSELNVIENDTYGASRFEGWGEYMRRKRAKLQIQNIDMEQSSAMVGGAKSQIFKGLSIYVSPIREVDQLELTFNTNRSMAGHNLPFRY